MHLRRTDGRVWPGLSRWLAVAAVVACAAPASAAAPALDLDSTAAVAGGTAAVTITLTRNGNAVAGTSNDIRFDSTTLSITPATACALHTTTAPGFSLVAGKVCSNGVGICATDADCTGANVPPCDIVRAGIFALPTAVIPNDGPLVTCTFAVSPSAPSGVSVLANTAQSSNAFGVPFTGTTGSNGAIAVTGAPSDPGVSGTIRYYGNGTPVADTAVTAQGAGTTTVASGAGGTYTIAGLGAGSWQITPAKSGDLRAAVTMLDAVYILQYLTGLRTFSPAQRLAADVTGNGTITTLDIVRIVQLKTALISRFPVADTCESDWAFIPVPVSQTLPEMSAGTCQPGRITAVVGAGLVEAQDFDAVLFGDCTGNWQ